MKKSQIFGWCLAATLAAAAFWLIPRSAPLPSSDESSFALSAVAAPQDQDVCFSPGEPCDLKLIKLIDGARQSIDIAIYDINLDMLVRHLIERARTLRVRVVVDRRQAHGDHSLVGELAAHGVPLRYGNQRGIMHDKFAIVDGRIVELGSFNFTNHAARANQENQLYTAAPAVVRRYAERFEGIWATAAPD